MTVTNATHTLPIRRSLPLGVLAAGILVGLTAAIIGNLSHRLEGELFA